MKDKKLFVFWCNEKVFNEEQGGVVPITPAEIESAVLKCSKNTPKRMYLHVGKNLQTEED